MPQNPSKPTLIVAAALIQAGQKFLIAQRPVGDWMEGHWEFPGGKLHPDEDPETALIREIHEELGVEIEVEDIREVIYHRYSDRNVLLLFYNCRIISGEPQSKLNQSLLWQTPEEMKSLPFLQADFPLVEKLIAESHRSRIG